MDNKKIFDYALQEVMDIPVLIKAADVRMTKQEKKYLAFTFQDKSGQIDAKYWDVTDEEIERYCVGAVVRLHGKREMYQNTHQVKILQLELLDQENTAQFLESVPMEKDAIESEINVSLCWIEDTAMARIVRHLYSKYKKEFYQYPAAKRHHHAVAGGLSYHTLSMLRLADVVCKQYKLINRSLLTAGIILHDLGKVIELSGVVGTDYTLSGNLLGHIVIISDEITKACVELSIDDSQESVLLLKHLILAHHGKLEYGSPVVPRIVEAEVIHHLDMIDAKLNMLEQALDRTEEGAFSEKIYGLNNQTYYKPIKNKKNH